MKVYNRKGLLLGGIWMLLALWNLVHDFGSPDPNALVQVRVAPQYFVRIFAVAGDHLFLEGFLQEGDKGGSN